MNQLLRFLLFIHDIMWQYLESEEDISTEIITKCIVIMTSHIISDC